MLTANFRRCFLQRLAANPPSPTVPTSNIEVGSGTAVIVRLGSVASDAPMESGPLGATSPRMKSFADGVLKENVATLPAIPPVTSNDPKRRVDVVVPGPPTGVLLNAVSGKEVVRMGLNSMALSSELAAQTVLPLVTPWQTAITN